MTARHKLLLCCFLLAICPPFLYCKLFCRQDGGIATPLAPSMRFSTPSLEKHYVLASPRKRGGGLTALQNRYSISSSFCNLPDCFQNCYTFCRQDGGDCFPLAQSLRCYPLTFKRVRFCCSVKPSQLWWGLPHPHHQLDFPHYPSKIANTLASHRKMGGGTAGKS